MTRKDTESNLGSFILNPNDQLILEQKTYDPARWEEYQRECEETNMEESEEEQECNTTLIEDGESKE